MTFQKLTVSIISLLFLMACNTTNSIDSEVPIDTVAVAQVDTVVSMLVDTVVVSELPDSLAQDGYVEETKALATVIEKKYGVQWDFCDCIVKSDSINKIMSDLEGISDDEIDIIFARWDEIDMHCKELITAPNTTPEERSKYSKKVKRCLRNAGIK